MSPRKKQLMTLTEVSRRTGISMPTLQKYKKSHADEIPSEGEGRKQRYPEEALAVFLRLRDEGLSRRGGGSGGGRKKGSKAKAKKKTKAKKKSGRKAAKAPTSGKAARDSEELLSLQRIKEITGISYPTLLRYVKLHLDRIPHVGEGRSRRYPKEAVDVFVELRKNSPRGRKPRGGRAARAVEKSSGNTSRLEKKITELQRSQAQLERQVRQLSEYLRRPLTVTLRR